MSWLRALAAVCATVALAQAAEQPHLQQAAAGQSETLANGLKIEYVYTLEGCEPKSKINDMLTMHYTGKLVDGTKFDSRYAARTTIFITLYYNYYRRAYAIFCLYSLETQFPLCSDQCVYNNHFHSGPAIICF